MFISNEAKVTCGNRKLNVNDNYLFIIDLVEEVIDKADEIVSENAQKMNCEFEVIVAPNKLDIEQNLEDSANAIEEHSRNVHSADVDDDIEFVDSITGSNGNPTPVVSTQCFMYEDQSLENNIHREDFR